MLSKKNSMVTMVTDEFLENRTILQKTVATRDATDNRISG